jgi:hypothetical protein
MVLLVSATIVLFWFLQGFGLASVIMSKTPKPTAIFYFVLATWIGLISNLILISVLYFGPISTSIRSITHPIFLSLFFLQIMVFFKVKPLTNMFPSQGKTGFLSVFISFFGTGVLLMPLINRTSIGFYYGGEYPNYALLADTMKFNPHTFVPGGSFGPWMTWPISLLSREGYSSLILSQISSILRIPTIWIVQPLVGAFYFVFSLILCQLVFRYYKFRALTFAHPITIGLLLLGFLTSSIQQAFWESSWLSNYKSLTIFLGLIFFITGDFTRQLPQSVLLIVKLVSLSLICSIYTEMYLLFFSFFAVVLFLTYRERRVCNVWSWVRELVFLFFISVFVNIRIIDLLFNRRNLSIAGFDIFGSFDEPYDYATRLLGLSALDSGGSSALWIYLFAATFVTSLFSGYTRFKNNESWIPLTLVYFVVTNITLWLILEIVSARTNYVQTKLFLTFSFIIIVYLAFMVIHFNTFALLISCALFSTTQVFFGYKFSEDLVKSRRDQIVLFEDAQIFRKNHLSNLISIQIPRDGNEILSSFILEGENLIKNEMDWPSTHVTRNSGSTFFTIFKPAKINNDPEFPICCQQIFGNGLFFLTHISNTFR